MNDTLTNALDLAERGYHLFPLVSGGKTPALTGNWQNAATRDPAVLRRWFARTTCNIAIACEPSGIFAIDLDTAKSGAEGPAHGIETLRELADGRDLPRTLTVATPSGGTHLYYRQPADGALLRNTARRLGPLIDTRGVGGYLVAPGSQINGSSYRITDDVPIAETPSWISALLRLPEPASDALSIARQVPTALGGPYARAALGREAARVATAKPGQRNHILNQAAYSLGRLIANGLLDRAQVESQLTLAAHAAGLGSTEISATVNSGITASIGRHRGQASPIRSTSVPMSTSGIAPTERAWTADTRPVVKSEEAPVPAASTTKHPAQTLAPLRAAFDALEHELDETPATVGAPRAQERTSKQAADHQVSVEDAAGLLDEAATTIRTIEPRAAALARTPEWHKIRAIGRAIADLVRQIREATRAHADDLRTDVYIHGAIRTLAARSFHQIAALADAAAERLASRGLIDSPTYADLRAVHRTAQQAEAKLTGRVPGQPVPEKHVAARTQLKEIRRSLRSDSRTYSNINAPKTAMRAAACPSTRRPPHM